MKKNYFLDAVTSDEFSRLVASEQPLVMLLPVGSVEPHGPHLTLLTDTIISQASAELAADRLTARGTTTLIAPSVPYGVTDCAVGFAGAVSIPAAILSDYLEAVVRGFIANGVDHVCVVNNHLEPAQFNALQTAVEGIDANKVSVACPLIRRWARTLSDEFKRGECHAGRYETSLILAAAQQGVKPDIQLSLPAVPVSLSDKLAQGIVDFKTMGMEQAYAGAPALATAAEGRQLLDKLATMIVTEVCEKVFNAQPH